jgi:thymidylate kinase
LVHLGEQLAQRRVDVVHPYDIVLLDRSVDTTYAYSALFFLKESDDAQLDHSVKIRFWHDGVRKPDLTFWFVSSYDDIRKRLQARVRDTEFDMMPEAAWNVVMKRYTELRERGGKRIVYIDAGQDSKDVHNDVMAAYRFHLRELIK